MSVHPCVDCEPKASASGWWRCRIHQRIRDRQRGTRVQRGYTNAWMRLSHALITAHVARFGWVCPGWQRAPHPSRALTLDHRVSLARGGTVADGVDVLCAGCNSRKGADGRPTRGAVAVANAWAARYETSGKSGFASPSKPDPTRSEA